MIKTTENELRKNFEDFGTIVDINLKQKDTGIVFAFVEFDSVPNAQKAVDAYSYLYRMKLHISPFSFCSPH